MGSDDDNSYFFNYYRDSPGIGRLCIPQEIGNLVNLKKLDISDTMIRSLPTSIRQLRCLKELNLSSTVNLLNLPEEIGNLMSLNVLNLYKSAIELLPPSIRKLKNLEELDLYETTISEKCLEEIKSLTSLKFLILSETVDRTKFRGCQPKFPFDLAQQLPFLGHLNSRVLEIEQTLEIEQMLVYLLACNRARYRVLSATADKMTPNVWPLLLNRARLAFIPYLSVYDYVYREIYNICKYRINKPDAIYHLLINATASFISVCANRNRKDD